MFRIKKSSEEYRKYARIWKTLWSLSLAAGIFLMCIFPYRALMNYHEQTHLFRWNGYYLKEQCTSLEGLWEYTVSFITQFFYIGWLGAAVVAVLAVILQWLVWRLLRLCRLRHPLLYPLTLIPSLLIFYYIFIPSSYKTDTTRREVMAYDYLLRNQKWDTILTRSYHQQPATMCGIWCTNYALAKQGKLLNDMFYYKQDSPDGLLMDAVRMDPMTLYSLSDISLDLGMVNSAERFAFDVKQRLPHGNKSGRIYKRLAETNLINGDYKIARKYMRILQSTLFYKAWADKYVSYLGNEQAIDADEQYGRHRAFRQKADDQLAHAKDQMLKQLATENPHNKLARDYLLAYEMLRLDLPHVTEYTLLFRNRDKWDHTPKALQEAVIGYCMLSHPNDSLPFAVNKDIFDTTVSFLQTVKATGNMLPASLDVPPYNQSYWHYHTQSITKLRQMRP